jgi:hypothetical protein
MQETSPFPAAKIFVFYVYFWEFGSCNPLFPKIHSLLRLTTPDIE